MFQQAAYAQGFWPAIQLDHPNRPFNVLFQANVILNKELN
jgi:hypothetical protein